MLCNQLLSRKIGLFVRSEEVVQDQVCIGLDVNFRGRSQRAGSVAGMRVKDADNNFWSLFIETRNVTDQVVLKKGLDKFFSRAKQRTTTQEIFVYLSYHQINNLPHKSEFDKKNNKEDFTLNIQYLNYPQESVIHEVQFLEKFFPSIRPKFIGKMWQLSVTGTVCCECLLI